MKILIKDLKGKALAWAVGCVISPPNEYMKGPQIKHGTSKIYNQVTVPIGREYIIFNPQSNWSQAGPIIEKELAEGLVLDKFHAYYIEVDERGDDYHIHKNYEPKQPLVATMRSIVEKHLGPEVEIPEALL